MGVYGYGVLKGTIPEGYIKAQISDTKQNVEILYPTNPGSVYHLTKSLDQLIFQFYAKNDKIRITDLHQGIVWGTQTTETRKDPRLINRFDYDAEYGTVLNRFIVQAAAGHPITIYGAGGQKRAFIHIQDTVNCVGLALQNPPSRGERVKIINQITEVHSVKKLAEMIANLTGATIQNIVNPRQEAEANELDVSNMTLLNMGLNPISLSTGLMEEVFEISKTYEHRCNLKKILPTTYWNSERREEASKQGEIQ
jgi:UDP-sulfoquinovose synthase